MRTTNSALIVSMLAVLATTAPLSVDSSDVDTVNAGTSPICFLPNLRIWNHCHLIRGSPDTKLVDGPNDMKTKKKDGDVGWNDGGDLGEDEIESICCWMSKNYTFSFGSMTSPGADTRQFNLAVDIELCMIGPVARYGRRLDRSWSGFEECIQAPAAVL
ncbi:hypothetical protein EJ04DRAFT_523259 [Polyplosphaeria fusca]|uniref:Uncharacterized protein n=1 Tax=Polyplosphaeria fusca TaxID=682080 RepID=A0A9P4V1T0_9PLEO|nr:hypothetical protein EJ04DRAFT_523259 [Polyplosphaeria fusca]